MRGWPFVGRERELEIAEKALLSRDARGVLILGQPGVGKTRLAEELAQRMRSRGRQVERIQGTPGLSSVPLGAVTFLLPEDAPATLWASFRSAYQTIVERRGGQEALILMVDDAHLLDETTAALVHHATSRRTVLPIITARPTAALPEPLERLWQEDLLERIFLTDLDKIATETILIAAIGEEATLPVRNRIWELSLGNPLLIRELVHAGIDALDGESPPDQLDRLFDIVSRRIGRLTERERRALEAIALLGAIEIALLEPSPGTEVLAALEDRSLVVVETEGRRAIARFAHPLHGEVLRAGMPRSRLRALSRVLVERLQATGSRRRDDARRIGLLHLEAGGELDPVLLRHAAHAAFASFDHVAAERLGRAAWSVGRDAEALLIAARTMMRAGRGEEAERALRDVLSSTDDPAVWLAATVDRIRTLAFLLGRVREARACADEAIGSVPDGPAQLAVRLAKAWASALSGSFADAIDLRQVIDRADTPVDVRVATLTLSTLGQVLRGRVTEAEADIEEGLALSSRAADPILPHLLETNRLMGFWLLGDLASAEELGRARLAESAETGVTELVALWATNLGATHERAGRYADAARLLQEATQIAERADPYAIRALAAGLAGVVWAQMGDLGRSGAARERLSDVREEDRRTRTIADRLDAWLRCLEGDHEGAARLAAERAREGIENDHLNWATITAYDAVRFGHPELVVDVLTDAAARADGALLPTLARHADARIEGDAATLVSVADSLQAMGFGAYAMEAFCDAARAYDASGDAAAARQARARVTALRSILPDVRTPPLREAPPRLTARETQIARLALRRTSRQIAEELGISVRTVDNHLAAVYTKLGIHGRAELATVLDLVPDGGRR